MQKRVRNAYSTHFLIAHSFLRHTSSSDTGPCLLYDTAALVSLANNKNSPHHIKYIDPSNAPSISPTITHHISPNLKNTYNTYVLYLLKYAFFL